MDVDTSLPFITQQWAYPSVSVTGLLIDCRLQIRDFLNVFKVLGAVAVLFVHIAQM
jgi:hypothetical protein